MGPDKALYVLPAYAGMILSPCRIRRAGTSAPRVCGDDPDPSGGGEKSREVLPAYAGMIPVSGRPSHLNLGAPRVCGDDPARIPSPTQAGVCSPRMRG